MSIFRTTALILLLSIIAFGQTGDILQFKARLGFEDKKEEIAAKFYSADETKLTLIGLKTIQVWDIPQAKLVESYPHEIKQLDRLFGMSYQISPDQSKVITLDSVGRDGDKKEDRVNGYVYDIQTGKRIAVLERPENSVRFAFWSADSGTVVTFSGLYNQKKTEIAFWNGTDLTFRQAVSVDGYSWHFLSPDGKRLYIGNGGRYKFLGIPVNGAGEGEIINVYNTQTGAVEKTLNDNGEGFEVLKGYTFNTPDGRYIAAAKNKNVIVWDTAGKSQPIYELTAPNQKNRMRPEGFSDDGKYLFIRQDGVDEYYDAATGQLANDVPKLVKLRRENEYFIKNRYTNILTSVIGDLYLKKDSVQITTDGKYALVTPCRKATILDLTAEQKLYTINSECHGFESQNSLFDTSIQTYSYSRDVFRLSPLGKYLINFRYDNFVVRDLKTGAIMQKIPRRQNAELMDVPKWNTVWDFKGRYALTTAEDERSILIWEINEN